MTIPPRASRSSRAMHYILRHVVLIERWQRQLDELVALCADAGIEEVLLMEQSHQIVTVPFTIEKHQRMAEIYGEYRRKLDEHGVAFSINVATIVGHSDAAVPDADVLPFERFVGDDLVPAHAVYCVTDRAWVQYAQRVVGLYAATGPRRLMIDDDFRSLNHTTSAGCFCAAHARLTAEALGRPVMSSQELLDALLDEGDDALAVKAAWQFVNAREQLTAARAIESAVHAVDPAVQVGLMNSGEPAHSAQGRDMTELLRAFAGDGQPILSRPAGGAYADSLHQDIIAMHQTSALSRSAVGDGLGDGGVWVSEVENWPHTRYRKSIATTRLQMRLHALWGADAITLNVYDYLGTPFALEPRWRSLLVEERPMVERIARARAGRVLDGVGLPWRPDIARYHRNRSHSPEALVPNRPLDTLLPLLGVPVQFTPSRVNAVLGDDILALSDLELENMLTGGLLIDAVAAEHLRARGFGSLVGGRTAGRLDAVVVERLTNAEFAGDYHGFDLPTDWFRLARRGEHIARWEPNPEARVLSTHVDEVGDDVGAAVAAYENDLGGRVVVFAQPVHELGWLHAGRAVQLRAVVRWLARDESMYAVVDDGPNIAPFAYRDPLDGSLMIALVNAGLDPVDVDVLSLGASRALDGEPVSAVTLEPLSLWIGLGS